MIIACVYTGAKYPYQYVTKLEAMVKRWMPEPYEFVTLTDRPGALPGRNIKVKDSLIGWWGKMQLFESSWREGNDVIYLDLDTLVIGPLSPLAALDVKFGICSNFTRAFMPEYRCRFGSCVMKISAKLDGSIWESFLDHETKLREECGLFGDQLAIEKIYPQAQTLQGLLPLGYFAHYRKIGPQKPKDASLVIFAGQKKPHNSDYRWVREEWT